jgi:hypothetical protein
MQKDFLDLRLFFLINLFLRHCFLIWHMVIVLGTGEGLVEILIEGLFVSIKQKSGFLFSEQRVFL